MRILYLLFYLISHYCLGQNFIGIGVSSGINNSVPGRFSRLPDPYQLVSPIELTVGKVYTLKDTLISLWLFGNARLDYDGRPLVGPGLRVYSGKGFGKQSYLKFFIEFSGYLATENTPQIGLGSTYFFHNFNGIDLFLKIGKQNYYNRFPPQAYLGIGYNHLIPLEKRARLRSPHKRNRKLTDCPYRYN